MAQVLFSAAFFFAYTVQAITGFAGNLFAMPVGVSLLGLTDTVVVLNVMGVLACGSLALMNLRDVNWREYGKIVGVMVVLMFVGIWLDTIMPIPVLLRIYGVIVIFVGAKNLFFPSGKDMPEWSLWIILALAGLIQGMFVSGGAFLVIYAVQKIKDKQQFRITLSMVWATLNLIYAGIALQAGYFTESAILVILICAPLAIASLVLGSHLQKKISPARFLKFVYALLICIGVLLLATA